MFNVAGRTWQVEHFEIKKPSGDIAISRRLANKANRRALFYYFYY